MAAGSTGDPPAARSAGTRWSRHQADLRGLVDLQNHVGGERARVPVRPTFCVTPSHRERRSRARRLSGSGDGAGQSPDALVTRLRSARCLPGSCSRAAARVAWARRRRGWTGTARRCCGAPARWSRAGRAGRSWSCARPGRSCRRCPTGCGSSADAREGRGLLQGLLAGMEAVDGELAFAASTDMPFLHPRFVAAACAVEEA